jgi:hypothetical protein
LFELAVALRLARAFASASAKKRRPRLLVGGSGSAYARYILPDGDDVQLLYQGWPRESGHSLRSETGTHHRFVPGTTIPDIFLVRRGQHPDRVVLELKATFSPGYLGSGLSQLLGYLAERPDCWTAPPSGWLVAPRSEAFQARAPQPGEPLWVVDAEQVADAAVERLTR